MHLDFQRNILFVSPGVCVSIDKKRSPAAPGDGLLHLLLPGRLQSRASFWLQTANGKSTSWAFQWQWFNVIGIAATTSLYLNTSVCDNAKSGCCCACRICQQSWSGRLLSPLRCRALFPWKGRDPMSTCTLREEWWETAASSIRYEHLTQNIFLLVLWWSQQSLNVMSLFSLVLVLASRCLSFFVPTSVGNGHTRCHGAGWKLIFPRRTSAAVLTFFHWIIVKWRTHCPSSFPLLFNEA